MVAYPARPLEKEDGPTGDRRDELNKRQKVNVKVGMAARPIIRADHTTCKAFGN